jgi:hypothetical protein
MGVGIYGYIDDVYAALPVGDWKAYFNMKMETRQYFKAIVTTIKTIVKTIRSPLFMVSIHCEYLNFVSCCLCYVHTSV